MNTPPSNDRGFTLVELLVVIGIIGVIAAIAIPVYSTSRENAINNSIDTTLDSVSARIRTIGLLNGRGGAVPAYGICQQSATFPTGTIDNVCGRGTWQMFNLDDTNTIADSGQVPDTIRVVGLYDNTGRFCIEGTSSQGGTSRHLIGSTLTDDPDSFDAPAEGTCAGSNWTATNVTYPPNTPPSTTTVNPGPSGVTLTETQTGTLTGVIPVTANSEYLVSFDGAYITTYTAPADGNLTCVFPSTDPCGTATPSGTLTTGQYVLTVRERATTGDPWTAASTTTATIP